MHQPNIPNGILLSYKIEWIWVSGSEVDEPRNCYIDEVSQKEKNYTLMHIYMKSRNSDEATCWAGIGMQT